MDLSLTKGTGLSKISNLIGRLNTLTSSIDNSTVAATIRAEFGRSWTARRFRARMRSAAAVSSLMLGLMKSGTPVREARSIAPAPKRVDPVARHRSTARVPSIAPNRTSLKRNRRPVPVEQHRAAEQIPGEQRQGIKSVISPAGNLEANGRRRTATQNGREVCYESGSPAVRQASAKTEKTAGSKPAVTEYRRIVNTGSRVITRLASSRASSSRPTPTNAAVRNSREMLNRGFDRTERSAASQDSSYRLV